MSYKYNLDIRVTKCYNLLYRIKEGTRVTIPEKLLRIRVEKSMSQEKLAKELGVSFATINRWENGRTEPTKRYEMVIDDYCKKNHISINDEVTE